jgi:hypothetical protein
MYSLRSKGPLPPSSPPPPVANVSPSNADPGNNDPVLSDGNERRIRKDSDLSSAPSSALPQTPTFQSFHSTYTHYLVQPCDYSKNPILVGKLDQLLALESFDMELVWQDRWKSVFDLFGNASPTKHPITLTHRQISKTPQVVQAKFSAEINGNSLDMRNVQDPMGTQLKSTDLHQWIVSQLGSKRSNATESGQEDVESGSKRLRTASEPSASSRSGLLSASSAIPSAATSAVSQSGSPNITSSVPSKKRRQIETSQGSARLAGGTEVSEEHSLRG